MFFSSCSEGIGYPPTVPGGGGVGFEPAATVTVVDWLADPPVPVQVNKNVVLTVRLPVLWEPEMAFAPDHPPDALHELALIELQVRVEEEPNVTEAGLAVS